MNIINLIKKRFFLFFSWIAVIVLAFLIFYGYGLTTIENSHAEAAVSKLSGLSINSLNLAVHAGSTRGVIRPYYQGFYDLNPVIFNYSTDPNFAPLLRGVKASVWRVSIGRWELGTYPTLAEIAEREYFTGRTLADAHDPTKYNWRYMDKLFSQVANTGMKPFISIDYMPKSLAKNTKEVYKWPEATFSNDIRNGPPADSQVFAEVITYIIKHYNQGWANGYYRNYQYWELWNEPDIDFNLPFRYDGVFWNGTRLEFFNMYKVVATRVKQEFGSSVKFGGASFAAYDYWVPNFLDFVKATNIPLDFLSYHMYDEDPMVFDSILSFVKSSLDLRGMGNVEIIVGEWGRILGDDENHNPWYDNMGQVLHHTTAFILMNNYNVSLATHSVIRDMVPGGANMGILLNPSNPKTIYYAYKIFDWLNDVPVRLNSESSPSYPIIIAGKNAQNSKIGIVFVNPTLQDIPFTLSVDQLPWGTTASYSYKHVLLSDATMSSAGGIKLIESSTKSGSSLTISKVMPGASLNMIVLTKL